MSIENAERRQIENEMIFRRTNEKISDGLEALDEMHVEDGNFHLVSDEDMALQFKCECSDEDCDARIPLAQSEYQKIHIDRDSFIVIPHHQVDSIETVLSKTASYNIVKKNHSVPEPSGALNVTTVDNS